jgi:ABC-type Zn2+ transport system substrate-binding protein/surface adhesin
MLLSIILFSKTPTYLRKSKFRSVFYQSKTGEKYNQHNDNEHNDTDHNDVEQNDNEHNDTEHNDTHFTLIGYNKICEGLEVRLLNMASRAKIMSTLES